LGELLEKCADRQQRGVTILKAAIDLTAVQKSVLAPKQAPMHTVAHPHPPKPLRCSD
jgi:hypothetical protein